MIKYIVFLLLCLAYLINVDASGKSWSANIQGRCTGVSSHRRGPVTYLIEPYTLRESAQLH